MYFDSSRKYAKFALDFSSKVKKQNANYGRVT